jgi:TROVE domain
MPKFANRPKEPVLRSPVRTTGVTGVNPQGGLGHARDVQSELYLLAVANMVSESTFYESAADRDSRFVRLVHAAVAADAGWVARLVGHLRADLGMRSVSVVAAAEYALAVRALAPAAREAAPAVREVVAAALMRADEPGEFLAYWRSASGSRAVPRGVQNGVADAVGRLFNERAALKYDGVGNGWRLGHVIDVVHPVPVGKWQSDLFAYLLDRAHHPGEIRRGLGGLPVIAENARVKALGAEARAWLLADPARLSAAGMTWEALSGLGPMDEAAWDAVIPSMGVFALARNLRNFDEAGISGESIKLVKAALRDPEVIARSRMFPFRFLLAYNAVGSTRWADPLSEALDHSLANVPALSGRTLILIDRSGSMFWTGTIKSSMTAADQAAVFGSALALRAAHATLVQFGSTSAPVPIQRGGSVLPLIRKFGDLGGTNTAEAVRRWYDNHDRVVIVTDEQHSAHYSPFDAIPAKVPVYTWNLAGGRLAHAPSTPYRHIFGGLTDAAFRMIPLLENGRTASWPF